MFHRPRRRAHVLLSALVALGVVLLVAGVRVLPTMAVFSQASTIVGNTFSTGLFDVASAGLAQLGHVQGCTSEDGSGGVCANGKGLSLPIRGDVSPDGKHVYVATWTSNAVSIFSRNATTGELVQLPGTAGCVSDTGTSGACVDGYALENPYDVAVSPDGAHVYVLSQTDDAVAAFARNATTGALTQLSGTGACTAEVVTVPAGTSNCADGFGLDGVSGIAIDPTGAYVYVASYLNDAVTVFSRNAGTGVLTELTGAGSCISHATLTGCTVGRALDYVIDVTVSPDGKHVYAVSNTSDAVVAFSRNTSTGRLTQLPDNAGACVSHAALTGCTVGKALDQAAGVAVSPDNAYVYVTSSGSSAVAAFARNTTSGVLTQLPDNAGACVSHAALTGCTVGKALDFASGVTISPDGQHLYVASQTSDAVAAFSRNTSTGVLTQLPDNAGACVSHAALTGCTVGKALDQAYAVLVSPNGAHTYAFSRTSNSVSEFTRNATTGVLTQRGQPTLNTDGCISEDGSSYCVDGLGLLNPAGVVVSPDNLHVYTAAYNGDTVAAFSRNQTTGKLTQLSGTDGCVSHSVVAGCVQGKALDAPWDIAISPDGRHVYVASYTSSAVAAFSRDAATGKLTQLTGTNEACVSNAAITGCTTGRALGGADAVAVSPDGTHVYVGANTGNAVAVFSRNTTTGALTQLTGTDGCLAETPGTPASTAGCANGRALTGIVQMAFSPNSANLYVSAEGSDAVAVLSRNTSTGVLSQAADTDGCYAENPGTPSTSSGCADGVALDNAYGTVVSSDGAHVYVASFTSDAIAAFTRNPTTGALTQLSGAAACIADVPTGATATCADGVGLDGMESLAINPAGHDVYGAALNTGAIVWLQRNSSTGALTQVAGTAGCISDDGTNGSCVDGKGLWGGHRVVVPRDGKDVYYVGGGSSAGNVSVFNRNR